MWILYHRFVLFVASQDHFPVEIYNLVHVRLDNRVLHKWSHKISMLLIVLFLFLWNIHCFIFTSKLELQCFVMTIGSLLCVFNKFWSLRQTPDVGGLTWWSRLGPDWRLHSIRFSIKQNIRFIQEKSLALGSTAELFAVLDLTAHSQQLRAAFGTILLVPKIGEL